MEAIRKGLQPLPPGKPMFKILAAVDKSRYASVVMDTVAKIASFTECNILVLTVIDSKRPRKVQVLKDDEETVREFHKDLVRKYFPQKDIVIESVSDSNKHIPSQAATIHSRTVEGNPADMICEWADNMNVDLVVVGKRGAGDSSASLLGSVSETVVHKCRRSVLVAIRERSDHANWDVGQASTESRSRSVTN
ncbi:MAG TPA: universal stress protein [Candidatus Bathyarchaeia archaeon]|nr:universal stress protein [Candidatus Bathyarchaeia archaeon]